MMDSILCDNCLHNGVCYYAQATSNTYKAIESIKKDMPNNIVFSILCKYRLVRAEQSKREIDYEH